MKYRVNLYRERVERAGRLRRGLFRGSLVGAVVGVEILLIILLGVSGYQLRERTMETRRMIRTMEEQMAAIPENKDASVGRRLLQARVERVDWATALERLTGCLPPQLVLSEIQGETATLPGGRMEMSLKGRVMVGKDLSAVLGYVSALRADSLLSRTFPQIDLGTAQGEGEQSFQILCRRPAAEPAS